MDIKLVALDMDGTLLDSQKRLPADFKDWVIRHPGIKTVIASGRQYYALLRDFGPIQDSLTYVAENGGLVFEKGEILYSNDMQKKDIKQCLELIRGINGATPIVCGANSAYMENAKAHVQKEASMYYARLRLTDGLYDAALQDTVVKIAIFVDEKKAESVFAHFPKLAGHLSAVLSGDSWIDISNKTVNKGEAIIAIQQKYGIPAEKSMAFGDYLNDVEMLKACGESYCMENGHPDLKALAKHVAASNDEDGVMRALRRI